jgi:[ribosomal protein S18]-alanine N-acetyltransferase
MPAGFSVRQAGPFDGQMLADLHRSCFARAWDDAAMMQFAASPQVLCLIGSVAGDVGERAAGFLIARKASDEAEIISIGVVPSCRKLGLGRALLETALELLRASGTRRLFLEVDATNEAALRLYRSFGGEAVGRRQGYYEHGADAAILSLAL